MRKRSSFSRAVQRGIPVIQPAIIQPFRIQPFIQGGVTKHSGLDLEKQPRSSGRGGTFFLTSLFIELIDTRRPLNE